MLDAPALLDGQFPNDFSGVGAVNGEIWAGLWHAQVKKNYMHRYDYVSNTFFDDTAPSADRPFQLFISGHISGIGFSQDGADMWVTANSSNRLYRFTWPGHALVHRCLFIANHQVADSQLAFHLI